jgi:phage terminase large subunit-like protein
MLQFGLRLGRKPRQLITTTPRPVPLLKRLMKQAGTAITHAPTKANALFLAPGFLEAVVGRYGGTRLGRQELDGELIEDRPDALWSRDGLEAARVVAAPEDLTRIVIAIDPPVTATAKSDACGIVAAGLGSDGKAYVLADRSRRPAKPADWAEAAIGLWHGLKADCLIAEVNQGGDMVAQVIASADPSVPVKQVRATAGQVLPGRAGRHALRSGQGAPCRDVPRAGRRDGRLRSLAGCPAGAPPTGWTPSSGRSRT